MNRYWTQVPVKVLKYKKLGILCCLVICMKFLLTSTDWTLTGKVRTVREFVSAKDLSTCNCTRGLQDRGVRTILEKTQNGPYEGSAAHNGSVFSDRFHLQIMSEDPKVKHNWPWGGQKIVKSCKMRNWQGQGNLPKTSVVVTFIDKENVVTLLRTVHSIIQRTPADLLEEIILVEDNCVKEEFHKTLDIYLDAVFGGKVRILRNMVTLGLIKARLSGIRAAKGEVVVCMDSHMEVQELWLEPLLYEIRTNRKTMATSYLDWIEDMGSGWTYRHGASSWKTYFDLGLVFGFQEISPKQLAARKADQTAAVECPVTVGTIWAMERQFFTEIGEFDEGMELWGGENLDLPLRVWLFGGRVVNVPCSHAAHLEVQGYRNYRSQWTQTINRNYKRFVQVWLPEYMEYFYPYFPSFEKIDAGDLSARYVLKQRAQYNMSWYLTNVFPELGIPQIHGLAWGEIINKKTEYCLSGTAYSAEMGKCGGPAESFYFFWSKDLQELRFPMHVFNMKKTRTSSSTLFTINRGEYTVFYGMGTSTVWLHWKNGPLMNEEENLCLQTKSDNLQIELVTCDFNNAYQQWTFSHYSKDYEDIIKGTSQKYSSLMNSMQKYKEYFNQNPAVL